MLKIFELFSPGRSQSTGGRAPLGLSGTFTWEPQDHRFQSGKSLHFCMVMHNLHYPQTLLVFWDSSKDRPCLPLEVFIQQFGRINSAFSRFDQIFIHAVRIPVLNAIVNKKLALQAPNAFPDFKFIQLLPSRTAKSLWYTLSSIYDNKTTAILDYAVDWRQHRISYLL